MATINPRLLEVERPSRGLAKRTSEMEDIPAVVKRSIFPSIMALAKKQLGDLLRTVIKDETVNVKISNEKAYISYLNTVVKRIDSLNTAVREIPKITMGDSPASIQIQTMSEATISKLTAQLEAVKNAVNANRPSRFPAVQRVQITNPAPVQQFPIEPILRALRDLEGSFKSIKLQVPTQKEVKFPEMPKTMSMTEGKAIVKALEDVTKKLDELPKDFPEVIVPKSVSIDNFPPQKYPMPVTNININPLRGEVKTRAVTVTTALTPLPGEVLAYRRAVVVYNNSASVTIYVGGSTMTAADGMPVPPNSYSPAFDAGPKMIIYARTSASTADVRVMELSNENIGG